MPNTKFKSPVTIQVDDTVGILSTARAIQPEEIETARLTLQQMGLNVVYGATIGATQNQFAGDDDLRLNDLQTMLDNPDIKGILCARGGYGTARLLDKIDWRTFTKKPKWILGYSDITALHNTISRKGIMSLHGIMPVNVKDEISKRAFREAIGIMMGKNTFAMELPDLAPSHSLTTSGILTGGNLSVLYSLRGTKYDIETEKRLLFIEDLDEYLYHIDRIMVNLKLSGMFETLAGIVVGGMTDMNDNRVPFGQNAKDIIASQVPEYVPLFFGAPFGHFANNMPIVCGAEASVIKKSDNWKLTYSL